MTHVDLHANIVTDYRGDDLMVVIPLVGEVTEMWRRRYDALARAKGIRAQCFDVEGSALIHLFVPVRTEGEDVLKTLDASRDLIAEADAAEQSPTTSNSPDAIARLWWARQQA
jgi:hypothetical protein